MDPVDRSPRAWSWRMLFPNSVPPELPGDRVFRDVYAGKPPEWTPEVVAILEDSRAELTRQLSVTLRPIKFWVIGIAACVLLLLAVPSLGRLGTYIYLLMLYCIGCAQSAAMTSWAIQSRRRNIKSCIFSARWVIGPGHSRNHPVSDGRGVDPVAETGAERGAGPSSPI